MWVLSLFAGFWKLWIKRNSGVFRNKGGVAEEVVEFVVWTASVWASQEKDFEDIPLQDMFRSCEAIFQRGRRETRLSRPHHSWMSPPSWLLWMNFVGSYLKNVRQGGWGYVIRDSSGWILHQFLGSIACDDANEA